MKDFRNINSKTKCLNKTGATKLPYKGYANRTVWEMELKKLYPPSDIQIPPTVHL